MPATDLKINEVCPTPLLKRDSGHLLQCVRMAIGSLSEKIVSATIVAEANGKTSESTLQEIIPGKSTHEIYFHEITKPCRGTFVLKSGDTEADRVEIDLIPPRRWIVHVVQTSHHDVGYTDLASHVLSQHEAFLDQVIEMADATRTFPDEAQFRIVVEQAWSIWRYLRSASKERVARMVELMRSGHVELTALFGNMTTELCGHETLARCVYHAFRLKRKYGIPIVSAEHNDVPGFSWGLGQVLTEAGVKVFCPGLPLYYGWTGSDIPSFWDEEAIFDYKGMPGAFWWEAPSGKRILFWCNNSGCGGDCRAAMPGLVDRLQQFQERGYPYDVMRWPVIGGKRDNSPYIEEYAQTIREWNTHWEYPRLICSTNARFYEDIIRCVPKDLPAFRGSLPGQDYPSGAASTAVATAVNRNNHADLPATEAHAAVAGVLTDCSYQRERLAQAYEETLWYDEHTWGHHFPCGPTALAAELEKALHAHRAAALTHDVSNKAMARIADAVRLDDNGIHLVVFNPLPRERTDLVRAPLREIDNCGSTMAEVPRGCGYLSGVLLHDRWHVNPPPDIVDGKFELVDVTTGETVPYQIAKIDSPAAPVPYAAQRTGLAAGGKRYVSFDIPLGLGRDLCFHAENVPPLGYRTYRLAPVEKRPVFSGCFSSGDTSLENECYRLEVDPRVGGMVSLVDKASGRELIDKTGHPFGALIVRDPQGGEQVSSCESVALCESGPVFASLRMVSKVKGHPRIQQTITLYARSRRIDFAVYVLKDSTPLLETYLAFPFHMPDGRFRYEEPLSVVDPVNDFFPGAFSDRLTAQNWIKVTDGDCSVLWSSLDAPVVSLGKLWPGRLSPAHSCVAPGSLCRAPQSADDLRGGRIYSCLFANNFRTNFAVSQSGNVLFRYVMTTRDGRVPDPDAAAFGWSVQTPLRQIFTKHPGSRSLPPIQGFLEIDSETVRLVSLKQAEDGCGLILRLWNINAAPVVARVNLPCLSVNSVVRTNIGEEDLDETVPSSTHGFSVRLSPGDVSTFRVR